MSGIDTEMIPAQESAVIETTISDPLVTTTIKKSKNGHKPKNTIEVLLSLFSEKFEQPKCDWSHDFGLVSRDVDLDENAKKELWDKEGCKHINIRSLTNSEFSSKEGVLKEEFKKSNKGEQRKEEMVTFTNVLEWWQEVCTQKGVVKSADTSKTMVKRIRTVGAYNDHSVQEKERVRVNDENCDKLMRDAQSKYTNLKSAYNSQKAKPTSTASDDDEAALKLFRACKEIKVALEDAIKNDSRLEYTELLDKVDQERNNLAMSHGSTEWARAFNRLHQNSASSPLPVVLDNPVATPQSNSQNSTEDVSMEEAENDLNVSPMEKQRRDGHHASLQKAKRAFANQQQSDFKVMRKKSNTAKSQLAAVSIVANDSPATPALPLTELMVNTVPIPEVRPQYQYLNFTMTSYVDPRTKTYKKHLVPSSTMPPALAKGISDLCDAFALQNWNSNVDEDDDEEDDKDAEDE